MIAVCEERQNITSLIVPCSGKLMRLWRRDNGGSGSKGRLVQEALVWIDFCVRGMIDGYESQLIDVVDFFHRLSEAQTEIAVAGF